jgi:hypothetical protein
MLPASVREGWDEFRSCTWLWTIMAVSAVFNFLYAAYQVLGPVVAQRTDGGAAAWAAAGRLRFCPVAHRRPCAQGVRPGATRSIAVSAIVSGA